MDAKWDVALGPRVGTPIHEPMNLNGRLIGKLSVTTRQIRHGPPPNVTAPVSISQSIKALRVYYSQRNVLCDFGNVAFDSANLYPMCRDARPLDTGVSERFNSKVRMRKRDDV
jgi:hypothetical protein